MSIYSNWLDKFVNIVKLADHKDLLKAGPNQIHTIINNHKVVIRIFIKEGVIKGLTKTYYKIPYERNEYILEMIKNLINEYLAKNPEDTDVRLRLVVLEFTPPWEDPELLSKYLNEIFKYDPDNIYATLILACTQDVF